MKIDFTDPRLFPPDGNAILWEVLGWNDCSITVNHILISFRQVHTRIAKFLTHLEEALNSQVVGTGFGNGVGCLCPNVWYVSGIEECMLYIEENLGLLSSGNFHNIPPKSLVPSGDHYIHLEPHIPYYPTCCCRCNEPFEAGFYCNLLILNNDMVCSRECAVALLAKRIEQDVWLHHYFSSSSLSRSHCPLPEDPAALRHHLQSIPFKDAFAEGREIIKPPVPEMTFATSPPRVYHEEQVKVALFPEEVHQPASEESGT